MYRTLGGRRGRIVLVEAKPADIPARLNGPRETPYISRICGGNVPKASRATPRKTARHWASGGGERKRRATDRAASVTSRSPRSIRSAIQARNAGTVGGMFYR